MHDVVSKIRPETRRCSLDNLGLNNTTSADNTSPCFFLAAPMPTASSSGVTFGNTDDLEPGNAHFDAPDQFQADVCEDFDFLEEDSEGGY